MSDTLTAADVGALRGHTGTWLRRNYADLVAAGMPARLKQPGQWRFDRDAIMAWHRFGAALRAANDAAPAASEQQAARERLAAAYGAAR